MKRIAGILIFIGFVSALHAQKLAEKAPLDPEFIKFATDHKKKAGADGSKKMATGYFPSPVHLHFNEYAFQPDRKKGIQQLPSSYDLRSFGYITSVKNQYPLGACWTFASIGAIESRWLQLGGYSIYNLDLSEENMGTCHGFEYGINDGGNYMIAAAYLTRLDGPVTEASDPYSGNRNATCPIEKGIIKQYVPKVTWLPKDINIVKKALFDYGAVASDIHVDQVSGGALLSMNNTDYTFYYGGAKPVNHGVLIVGWDDNKIVTGGTASPGQSIGAWIVKNSWGTEWGDNGYFYVSYEDTRFLSSVSLFPDRMEKSEVDTLYMYDKLGMTTLYGFRKDVAYGLAKFSSPKEHFVSKVGTFTSASGSIIDIEIYDDFDGDTLTNLLAVSEGNFCKFPGYHTVDIPAVVDGDYYVKIRYYSPGYGYPIPAEAEISFQGEAYALPALEDSGFFWISRDGEKWEAMGANIKDHEADLCIRAYADRNITVNSFFKVNKSLTCVGAPVTFTNHSNGDYISISWNFGPGSNPVTANTIGPHSVTYSTAGTKEARLTLTGSSRTSIYKTKIEVVDELDIFLPYSETELVDGKSLALIAYGADEYTWSPAEGLDTTRGPSVVASPLEDITYTVYGTLGNCTGSASISITIVENPDNDDVCEAFELTATGNYGVFTNINATAEDGEPAPEEGECDEPMKWCVEGGVQNSVWFKFIGPPSGIVSFDAPGMDNQLAIYKAKNCDSIFEKNGHELIAAFDDYYDEDKFFAAALENVEVIPGEQYFLQVDGSAGGVEGEFTLIYRDWPLSRKEYKAIINELDELKIFPNPGNGVFELSLSRADIEAVRISIFDASGKIVFLDEFNNIPGVNYQLRLENLSPGYYYLNLNSDKVTYHRNLIIK